MRLNSIAYTPLRAVTHFKFKVDHHHFYEQNALTHFKMCFFFHALHEHSEGKKKVEILIQRAERKKLLLQ